MAKGENDTTIVVKPLFDHRFKFELQINSLYETLMEMLNEI